MAQIRYAVLNDIHFPYESSAYYDALKIIKSWDNLKGLYLNGDIAEIESVSSHPKGPAAQTRLLDELEYVNQKFDQIQTMFPDIPVTVVEGNHCYRVFRYIRDVAPQMWGLIQLPELFKFSDRPGWRWIPYGPTQWVQCGHTRLWLRHEPLGGGQTHAKLTAEKSYVSVLYGHTHSYQQFAVKKHGPNPYMVTATSGGFLGDISKPVFDYRGSKDNWQLGFTEVIADDGSDEFEIRFHHMKDKSYK